MKHIAGSFIIVLLAMHISIAAEDVPTGVFGGADVFKVFNTAPLVTASRLAPPPTATDRNTRDYFDPLKYRAQSTVSVRPETVQDLRTILTNPDNYQFGVTLDCVPHYGIRLTFKSDTSTVVLDFCLQCSILAVTCDGKPVRGGGIFDPASPRLIAIAKALFPADKELQAFTK